MTENEPTYQIKKLSKAKKPRTRSLKVSSPFHALLIAMYNETDESPFDGGDKNVTMQRLTETALRIIAEKYYPQCLPVLHGDEIDESKRPEHFENSKASKNSIRCLKCGWRGLENDTINLMNNQMRCPKCKVVF